MEIIGSHNHLPINNVEGMGMPYDLSANDFTKMALVDLSDSKQMISSKLTT